MSNNKQSSVEWLMDKLFDSSYMQKEQLEWFDQAKAMHKEEKIKFATDFFFWWYNQTSGTNTYEAVEKYYNETYGGSNE
jgi:hypothetical protein